MYQGAYFHLITHMPHVLSNKVLEIHLDVPLEGYSFSRFDWTGKITQVLYRNLPVTATERTDQVDHNLFGKGLYNEFGIDTALGFQEAKPGEWFHKIGVGALKKTDEPYQFTRRYKIRPARFQFETLPDSVLISCLSETLNGYAYELHKEIKLQENSLIITYQLENKGRKVIETEEYVHNFMGVAKDLIGKDYLLRFPFELDQNKFQALVNSERKMAIGKNEISFLGIPNEQFFVSHLNGEQTVSALWELHHHQTCIGMRETGSFSTQKVNLWGWQHVISPELFQNVSIDPGNTEAWTRTYQFFNL